MIFSYRTLSNPRRKSPIPTSSLFCWRARRDLNPCYRRESGMAKRNSNKLQEHGRTGWRARNSRKHLIVSPMCPLREIGHSLKAAWVLPRRRETRNVVSALEKIGPLVSNLGFRSSTERFRSLAVALQLSHSRLDQLIQGVCECVRMPVAGLGPRLEADRRRELIQPHKQEIGAAKRWSPKGTVLPPS